MSEHTLTISKSTYSEMLATIPWVALLPKAFSRQCQWAETRYGRGKTCKAAARLLYINLDGTQEYFCHHHLYDAKMADGYNEPGKPSHEERVRNEAWRRKHVTFGES